MTSETVIRYLANKIPGGWYTIAKPRPQYRQIYRFVVTGNNAYSLLESVMPYLVEKQDQAKKLLELRNYARGQGIRPTQADLDAKESIFVELKAMHL